MSDYTDLHVNVEKIKKDYYQLSIKDADPQFDNNKMVYAIGGDSHTLDYASFDLVRKYEKFINEKIIDSSEILIKSEKNWEPDIYLLKNGETYYVGHSEELKAIENPEQYLSEFNDENDKKKVLRVIFSLDDEEEFDEKIEYIRAESLSNKLLKDGEILIDSGDKKQDYYSDAEGDIGEDKHHIHRGLLVKDSLLSIQENSDNKPEIINNNTYYYIEYCYGTFQSVAVISEETANKILNNQKIIEDMELEDKAEALISSGFYLEELDSKELDACTRAYQRTIQGTSTELLILKSEEEYYYIALQDKMYPRDVISIKCNLDAERILSEMDKLDDKQQEALLLKIYNNGLDEKQMALALRELRSDVFKKNNELAKQAEQTKNKGRSR